MVPVRSQCIFFLFQQFISVPWSIGSSGGYEGWFSRDHLPVFSAGGPSDQFWNGQGCPLYDVLAAFPVLTTVLPTPQGGPSSISCADHGTAHLQGAQKDGFGEAAVACDMPDPYKFPSLDSCQILWTHKEDDLALHPVVYWALKTNYLLICWILHATAATRLLSCFRRFFCLSKICLFEQCCVWHLGVAYFGIPEDDYVLLSNNSGNFDRGFCCNRICICEACGTLVGDTCQIWRIDAGLCAWLQQLIVFSCWSIPRFLSDAATFTFCTIHQVPRRRCKVHWAHKPFSTPCPDS